jgi:capsular exopolysaccharide synthesis family protein
MSARELSPLLPDGPTSAVEVAPGGDRIEPQGTNDIAPRPITSDSSVTSHSDATRALSVDQRSADGLDAGADGLPGAPTSARTSVARDDEPREAIPLDQGSSPAAGAPSPAVPSSGGSRAYLPALQRRSLRIGEIMLSRGLIGAGDIETVLEEQRAVKARFGEILIARGIADASDVVWALSQQAGAGEGPVMLQAGASEELVMVRQPYGQASEIIRSLRAQLLSTVLSPELKPRRALALVSANGGDGKTYLAANLALSLAQLGGRTIVVEADLRSPRLHEVFMLPPGGAGLTGTLSGSHLLRESVAALPDLPNLHLLPAGSAPANPVELLQQPAFALLLTTLLSQYDHVLVDTAAFDAGTDARVVAERCGMAIALARKGRTRMDSVHAALSQLQRAGVKIAGLVMNSH